MVRLQALLRYRPQLEHPVICHSTAAATAMEVLLNHEALAGWATCIENTLILVIEQVFIQPNLLWAVIFLQASTVVSPSRLRVTGSAELRRPQVMLRIS